MSDPTRLTRRAAVVLTLSFFLGGAAVSSVMAVLVHENVSRESSLDDCHQDVRARDALRAVVREAFRDEQADPVTLPPDPRVPPEFIEYLQDLVNRMSTTVNRHTARDRLLARAPRLGCTEDGESFEIATPRRETP